MALAPRTVQNIPDPLQREPIMVLQPASTTPEPTNRCWRRNSGLQHALGVVGKVLGLLTHRLRQFGVGRVSRVERTDEFLDLPFVEHGLVNHHPAFLLGRVLGVELASQIPQVSASTIMIHDSARKCRITTALLWW